MFKFPKLANLLRPGQLAPRTGDYLTVTPEGLLGEPTVHVHRGDHLPPTRRPSEEFLAVGSGRGPLDLTRTARDSPDLSVRGSSIGPTVRESSIGPSVWQSSIGPSVRESLDDAIARYRADR